MRSLRRFFNRPGNLSRAFCGTALLAAGAALLAYPEAVKEAVLSSALYCLTVLTPSLFPFMALTSFAVNSGASQALGRLFGFLPRWIFRLPGCCAAPLVLSFIGGYPAGAKAASTLLREGAITSEQAGRMMMFCVNPGIAFVITFVGGSLLGNPLVGWMLFLSITLSSIFLGFLSALPHKIPPGGLTAPRADYGNALVRCGTDACSAILKMSACVMLFSGFTAILHGSGIYQLLIRGLSRAGLFTSPQWAAVLSFSIEVTGGAGDAIRFHVSPGFFAFGLAFGGLCVHLQAFSFFQKFPLAKWKFFLFRFLHGFLSAAIFQGLTWLAPSTALSCSIPASAPISGGLNATLAGSASLLLMCSAFLLLLTKGNDCKKKEKLV